MTHTIILTHIPTNKVRRMSGTDFLKLLPSLNHVEYQYDVEVE